jgi:signal transduction histidine kinase
VGRGDERLRTRPDAGELASLGERARILSGIRSGFVAAAVAVVVFVPGTLRATGRDLVIASAAYSLLLLAPPVVSRLGRSGAQRLMGGTLLADGVYLAWLGYVTGGTQSPLRFLVLVHIAAATILGSARTGLKLAAWHCLLFVVALYAQASAIVPVHEALRAALPGGADFPTVAAIVAVSMWVVALATAASSSLNERQLRAQKGALAELSAMVREMDATELAVDIPRVLLNRLCRVFGFTRGVVLAAPDGELRLAAAVPPPPSPIPHAAAARLDAVIERAWNDRSPRLVPALDPERDAVLASALPGARNVLVMPLLVDRGDAIGVVALEHPGRRIRRWVVTLVERFASHTALTLHNAWLRDRLEGQLAENRALQGQLVEHNLRLEATVQERTRELRTSLEELRVLDEQRRNLLAHLVHAEEEERRRIAGDVHDDPVQKMSAATMRIQVLRRGATDPAQLEQLDKLMDVVRGSIASLRQLIFELRPHALDDEGLAAALRDYLDSLDAGFTFAVEDHLDAEPPPELRVVLYRVAQEAIANIRKHARAGRVEVRLDRADGGYRVRIADDGVGFAAPSTLRSARGHLGLTSMRERAEMAGGRCSLESEPGRGTTVELWVPGPPHVRPAVDEVVDPAVAPDAIAAVG